MATVVTQSFDPEKSLGKTKAILKFLEDGGFDDVKKVPGIGKVFAGKLETELVPPINTVYQLIGRFLQFRGTDVSQEKWCQSMYNFLVENSARTNFAQYITYALAELLNLYFPDLYDGATFEKDKCKPNDSVDLPKFSVSTEGTTFDASVSSVSAKAMEVLITNSTKYDYCISLSNIKGLGFGKVTRENLSAKGITSLYQIYGIFLGFHSKKITQVQWTQLCYRWCIDNGVAKRYCAGITDAICNVLDTAFPGLYDRGEALGKSSAPDAETAPAVEMM